MFSSCHFTENDISYDCYLTENDVSDYGNLKDVSTAVMYTCQPVTLMCVPPDRERQ